jgi:hypothetical protein
MRFKLFEEYSKEAYYTLVHDMWGETKFSGENHFDRWEIKKLRSLLEDRWVLTFASDFIWLCLWEKEEFEKSRDPNVYIWRLPDEYYLVVIYPKNGEMYKCDQFDGLKELLLDKGILTNES